jgi:Protein of unknown function (DUF732)
LPITCEFDGRQDEDWVILGAAEAIRRTGPTMKHTIAGAAAAGLAGLALATAPVATAGPEEDFLVAIAAAGLSTGNSQQLIAAGRAVCTDRAAGVAFNQVVQNAAASSGLNPAQAGILVGAATAAFCPQLT